MPNEVEGLSLIGERRRNVVYGEHYTDGRATRMIRESQYKLVYYPVGNRVQMFNLDDDPDEIHNLAGIELHKDALQRLTTLLVNRLYGSDLDWIEEGRLVGLPDREWVPQPDSGLEGQRGLRFM